MRLFTYVKLFFYFDKLMVTQQPDPSSKLMNNIVIRDGHQCRNSV